ncbi:MAG: ABC transporter ATP-binding protein [Acidobacteriota bacterium]
MAELPLLEVRDLRVEFPAGGGWIEVVRGLSFSIERGEAVGLVGESGSGKSASALALLRLLEPAGRQRGEIRLDGKDLQGMTERELQEVRGGRIGLVFQEPMTALNPAISIGEQVAETVRAHRRIGRREARFEAIALLERVALPNPSRRYDDYPHQLSGGQRQRVLIAAALAGGPALLIADEPTTALDVTLQAQVLDLLRRLRDEMGLAVLLITHDLAVVAQLCQRVLVLYAGRLVEEGPIDAVFSRPAHPYTEALLRSVPRLGQPAARGQMPSIPGSVPDPSSLPAGCAFAPRCGYVMPICREEVPQLEAPGPGIESRLAACHLRRVLG